MRTLIIGAGLSGLALAEAFERAGHDYLLVDARARVGGRILTEHVGGAAFDLGPAWFWPGQPRIAALIERLGLQKFDQYAAGALTFEDAQGHVQRGRGFASMEGSWRLEGGLGAVTAALHRRLSQDRVRLNALVTALSRTRDGIAAKLAGGETLHAGRVVLALPPRVATQIDFEPALPKATMAVMGGVPTWMAGQAKAVAVYETAFWRTAGLSGDVTSRFGPMVEIHDASPDRGGPGALFGFIGVPPEGRADVPVLRQQLLAQLVRLFGPDAAQPIKLIVQDWAYDPLTATDADRAPLYAHPDYGMPAALQGLWDGRLSMTGTEVAQQFGGYLEGALEAAEAVMRA